MIFILKTLANKKFIYLFFPENSFNSLFDLQSMECSKDASTKNLINFLAFDDTKVDDDDEDDDRF